HNPADFEVRTREGVRSTDAEQGGLIDVASGQEYRIINTNDGSTLTGFRAANHAAAEQEAMSIIRDLRLNPLNFDVV
ncbi:hypothetical protein LAJ57_14230, partial [Streptococcus pneumoniae]|uniref:hypothetical protein n=1 Tax=Streptococcus pneumoniae TaxID=1313 RepID=UPI001CBE4DAE